MRHARHAQAGFTLTELGVAVAIIALLLGGLLATIDTRKETENLNQTRQTLDLAREALIGFAVQNGRLPCPASAASAGQEVPNPVPASGACAQWDGFLPAVTLGLAPRDAGGFAVDAWNNRIRYRVSNTAGTNGFTQLNRLRNLGFMDLTPDLEVCVPALGTAAAFSCPADFARILTAAVVFSPGRNFALAGAPGADEAENQDGDVAFFSRQFSEAGSPRGEFDDIVVFIPTNVLYSRLVSAGPY